MAQPDLRGEGWYLGRRACPRGAAGGSGRRTTAATANHHRCDEKEPAGEDGNG